MLLLTSFLILSFLDKTLAKQMGCISNVTFISTDIKIVESNVTFNQCACIQWQEGFSGFNYFTFNQTCELYQNFTSTFQLVETVQTQFCFLNRPTETLFSALLTTKSLPDSVSTSSAIYTTSTLEVTTSTSLLQWNSTGTTVAGNGSSDFLSPYGIFVDDQYYIYIAEYYNNRTSKWPPNPNGLASAPLLQTAAGQLQGPLNLYVSSVNSGIFVADSSNHRVMYFANRSTTGSTVSRLAVGGSSGVNAIYLDPNGTIFVTDTGANRVYNWITNQTVAGGQGPGSNASQLSSPKRFFIDSNYSFYIADSANNRVQKWVRGASSGTTVAGGQGQGVNASQLSGPLGVLVDSEGGVIVCDTYNNRIQRWPYNASVGETIAGNANGTAGSDAKALNSPRGFALDKDNNLFVADFGNARVQMFKIF